MEYIKLGCVIQNAKTDRCGDGDYPVLSITKSDGIVLQSDKFKKRIASQDTAQYKIVNKGQLVQGIHIDEANFGIQDIVDAGIVSPAYKIWDVDSSVILPKYLEEVLRSPRSIQYYSSNFNGSIKRRERLSDKDFLAMEIPCPPIEEQSYVLKVIAKVRSIIAHRQNELQKLDELVKARFVEMFGSIHESTEYPYLAVKEFTDVVSGGTPSRDRQEFWDNGTIPWVKTTELHNNIITSVDEHITEDGLKGSSAKIVPADTVLIAMYGQGKTRGMTGYLGIEASTNQACACILPSQKINSVFLWKYFELSYDKLRDMAKGGNQPNLNGNMIKNFPVLMPPIALQEEYVAFVKQVDKSKVVVQKALDEAQLLFDSLMQECFG